ncbi:MAG: SUMF1/EgtB/PvdO family nonheme iron enzyme [Anaerolineales bacterium]|nr:SUMF1/EgtB/PvdO family nonheme iron enzyme [Anaerolineales bacterium]
MNASGYRDFELEIGPGLGREYPLAVLNSPAGQARENMHFPFDDTNLEIHLLKLENALLRTSGEHRRVPSPEEKVVQEFGKQLFEALLTGEVRSRFDVSLAIAEAQDKGLRLQLRIQTAELAALPWEYLYDPRQGDYICLSRNTPIIRYMALPQGIRPLEVKPPLCVLGMIASPDNLEPLDISSEKRRIEQSLEKLQTRGSVSLDWIEGQHWHDLQEAMQGGPWHVFHFIGHGRFNRNTDEGEIALTGEDGLADFLGATKLARLLSDQRSLRLVLLNACKGAHGSQRDLFSSTAATLVRKGLPAMLAMQYEITDKAAIEFSRAFYKTLAGGYPVDAAVSEARKAIDVALNQTLEWGVPVLYMRSPDGVLFKPTELPEKVRLHDESKTEAVEKVPQIKEKYDQPGLLIELAPGITLELVYIPAGEFLMGSDKAKDYDTREDELPQHIVYLEEYLIGKYPITNIQYQAFLKATGHHLPDHWRESIPEGKEQHPVVWVTWEDAIAFCEWINRKSGFKICLPSEAEWEKAARGPDERIWPWGNRPPDKNHCNFNNNVGGTSPIGLYRPQGDSPYSCVDMAGNVWEWTSSIFKGYPYDAKEWLEDLQARGARVLRGGSFDLDRSWVRCTSRLQIHPKSRGIGYGFRIALLHI